MFKPTAPLFKRLRRLQLTTKQAGHDFYRGTRTGSMGQHTKWGGYTINWMKVRTYVVPQDLADFHVGIPRKIGSGPPPKGNPAGDTVY